MKAATRVLAVIATGGVVIGGGTALWQLPEPKTTNTASTTTNASDSQAVQQLVQEGAQLHAAVEAARLQIASLDAAAGGPTPTGDDKATVLAQAQQLAQAKAALAAISQQLATDDALIARLEHGSTPRPESKPSTASTTRPTTGVPWIGDDPTTYAPAPIPTTATSTTSPTPRPSRTRTASPTSSPTNGRSDD